MVVVLKSIASSGLIYIFITFEFIFNAQETIIDHDITQHYSSGLQFCVTVGSGQDRKGVQIHLQKRAHIVDHSYEIP